MYKFVLHIMFVYVHNLIILKEKKKVNSMDQHGLQYGAYFLLFAKTVLPLQLLCFISKLCYFLFSLSYFLNIKKI